MKQKYLHKLAERKEKGSLRSLSSFEGFVDFYSNDYLGLAREGSLISPAGSTGSRLISGNSKEAEAAEAFMAEFYEAPSALVFNSGYDANLGFFSSVPQKGDTIIYDELIHASVRDGIRLSLAKSWSFKHNDTDDLAKKIMAGEGTVYVAVESLYSMDGDFAPLSQLSATCDYFKALLVVDEAHTGGVFGKEGRGLAHELDVDHECFARLITFGKAYGSHGAVVLGDSSLKEYLVNFARSFIYTTALPPAHYTHLKDVIQKAGKADIQKLKTNIRLFRNLIGEERLLSDADSPVQVVPYPSEEICLAKAKELQENGLAVKAILPPTVPEGGQRLRICIHAFNTEDEIRLLSKICS